MKNTILKTLFFLQILIWAPYSSFAKNNSIIESTKKAVVSIKTIANYTTYEHTGSSHGTGFIIDKTKGWIVTNRHVARPKSTSTYEVTFFDGSKTDAKLKYYSQWVDLALLEVQPKFLPSSTKNLRISKKEPKVNQKVIIIGNNSGEDFSIQTGTITNLLQTDNYLDTQNLRVSLNTKGGSSGSPVVDMKGEVVGINHAGSQTAALAIKADYLTDIYNQLLSKNQVIFRNPGFLMNYISLNDFKKYANLPQKIIDNYNKAFPNAMFKIMKVNYVFFDSDAAKYLRPGDVVWSINGKEFGPNLFKIQQELNKSSEYTISVYRGNKLLTFRNIKSQITNSNKIKKFISFGGASFYESDDSIRFHIGTSDKALMISNVSNSGSFSESFPPTFAAAYEGIPATYISPKFFNNKSISNLEELERAIPELIKNEYFLLSFNFHGGSYSKLKQYFTNSNLVSTIVKYNKLDENPRLFWFDEKSKTWQSKNIH